jgi:bacillithiol biosynthesis cysteine-adding enzyme BshC
MEALASLDRVSRAISPRLARVLAEQNATLVASPARDANLAALAAGAAAVVTGQQVGLFLGPLYTIYKAASAIVVARALARESHTPVVPVFWLQTEDHDLVEIAGCAVPRGAACERIAVPVDADNRVSIAHLALPDSIETCLQQLVDVLGAGDDATAHVDRLRRHYRPGARWADAFAGVLAELFAPEGLIVIDPRDAAIAEMVAPIHARALDDAARLAAALDAGQVHVRPGAPLSFFHPDGPGGRRVRLDPAPGGYVEVGGDRVHDVAALRAALADDPLSFSTSALLRPIVQDTLLPTAAYVGGPAELAYIAQLPALYRAFDMTPPAAIGRARFRIVDHRARKLLRRLGLAAGQLDRPEHELVQTSPSVDVANRLLAPFLAAHAELATELGDDSPAIVRALAKTRSTVEYAVARLAANVAQATSYHDSERVDAIRRLRAWLAPEGAPQERVLALAGFAARGGDRALIERVLAAIEPFDPTLKEIE